MNVLFVSHCDFHGNSAFHVLAVARELFALGHSPAIAVPDDPRTVDEVGRPPFPVIGFGDDPVFPDGRGPDLIHAWTPREHVRRRTEELVARHGCPYVLHLEDNEEVVLADALGREAYERLATLPPDESDALVGPRRSHPERAAAFAAGAAGMTAVIDTLLDRKPPSLPGAVFWPGFDPAVLNLPQNRSRLRSKLRLGPEDFALVYTGNVHDSNLGEVRELYLAVAALRDEGLPVRLVKTGWNHVDMRWAKKLRRGVRDLGFVSRARLWEVLAIADAFVQPGSPGPFNDLRFPSKLPDFLATGKPVVLPATNIGRYLQDGVEALLLRAGHAEEIAATVRLLHDDAGLRASLGTNGKAFALRELRWSANVKPLPALYERAVDGVSPRRGT